MAGSWDAADTERDTYRDRESRVETRPSYQPRPRPRPRSTDDGKDLARQVARELNSQAFDVDGRVVIRLDIDMCEALGTYIMDHSPRDGSENKALLALAHQLLKHAGVGE